VHDRRLGPSLVTFHIQLMWRNWLAAQLDAAETMWVEPPAFGVGISMMEAQNNLMWLPMVTNVPLILYLCNTPRAAVAVAPAARAPVARAAAARTAAPTGEVAPAAEAAFCDAGRQVRNPNRAPRLVGNNPFAQNVRSRALSDAIATAGSPPPMATRNGSSGPLCIYWHARGQCFENCTRSADHGSLAKADATELHTWCELAYA
jgi:hypothetical protein